MEKSTGATLGRVAGAALDEEAGAALGAEVGTLTLDAFFLVLDAADAKAAVAATVIRSMVRVRSGLMDMREASNEDDFSI